MAQPTPEKIDEARLPELARETIGRARFPMLATVDGDPPDGSQPRLRPVSPVRVEGFTVYVANLRSYHKTKELSANPKVELCYLDEDHNQVRITGTAHVLEEGERLQKIWNESNLLRQYFDSVEDDNLVIYRIEPRRVRYMQEWALEYYEVPL